MENLTKSGAKMIYRCKKTDIGRITQKKEQLIDNTESREFLLNKGFHVFRLTKFLAQLNLIKF